jgi:hypothetical protein
VVLPSGQRIYLREYAFVAPSQLGRPPTGRAGGPWTPLIGEAEKVAAAYRKMRRQNRRVSRWYRRNQAEIQERQRTDPMKWAGIGKGADWARLYPHGRKRILAWREVY